TEPSLVAWAVAGADRRQRAACRCRQEAPRAQSFVAITLPADLGRWLASGLAAAAQQCRRWFAETSPFRATVRAEAAEARSLGPDEESARHKASVRAETPWKHPVPAARASVQLADQDD